MKNINSYSPEQECHADLYGEPCSGECDICPYGGHWPHQAGGSTPACFFHACAWAVVFISISAGFRDTEPYGFSGAKNTRSPCPPKNPETPLDLTLKI